MITIMLVEIIYTIKSTHALQHMTRDESVVQMLFLVAHK